MLQLAKARSHIIFNDIDLNTQHAVYLNIYQNFLLSALKMNGYIRDWGLDTKKHAPFLRDTVEQMIIYASAAIRNKASTQFSKTHGGRSDVQKTAVTWCVSRLHVVLRKSLRGFRRLGLHAFHTVLSRKPARYSSLLKDLQAYLGKPLNRRYGRRFEAVTREGLAELAPI
ncbi:hypothetical protein DFH07DRAFT_413246 [Mycena maculata]|uniref:Telomerase reverse transcriptase n=1 Tax=Mycena maculata TaxID=230809 RepID=A0AAD7NII1_9AGAR|nr:hypothetical protein DFH07DRAFT_413246 [Mycena maculata]